MRVSNANLRLLAACGMAASLAGAALAQPTVINISGSTLFGDFFAAPASTNDFIDANNNNCPFHHTLGASCGLLADQLAPYGYAPFAPSEFWAVQYRESGSGNGFAELLNWGTRWSENAGTSSTNGDIKYDDTTVDNCRLNRTLYKTKAAGATPGILQVPPADANHPGGAPFICDETTLLATTDATSAGSKGFRFDMAVLDVPPRWFVTNTAASGSPLLTPGVAGYGNNTLKSVDPSTLGHSSQGQGLKSLTNSVGTTFNLYSPPAADDALTIFDTPIAFAVIGTITNFGTGMQDVTYSNLRYLTGTGRAGTGENLVFVTRDSGSGTRNGFDNSIGFDPSWGVGDNFGPKDTNGQRDVPGPLFVPSNKGSSGAMENCVQNQRLAIGYTGAERGASFLPAGKMEFLGLIDDVHPRASGYSPTAARPTIDNVLDNGLAGEADPSVGAPNPVKLTDGYRMGGPETFASVGDPRAAAPEHGGAGWPQWYYDMGDPRAVFEPASTHHAMRNSEAAAYLNNITRSIAAFSGSPGGTEATFSPGEYLGTFFVLSAATDYRQNLVTPFAMEVNTELNQPLQDYVRAVNVLGQPAYQAFGAGAGRSQAAGKVPSRLNASTTVVPPATPTPYSDGVVDEGYYVAQDGGHALYGSNLAMRNLIAGDFNGDGVRDLGDVADMIAAYRQRWDAAHPVWTAPNGSGALLARANSYAPPLAVPGSDAIIEVLGDFNGDGNFDAADVRYWADGLAIQPTGPHAGKLDRKAGFTAVDNASAAAGGGGGSINFFGVAAFSTGAAYTAGAARADVAGGRITDANGVLATVVGPNRIATLDSFKNARGFAPMGADGRVDGTDIDYVYANMRSAGIASPWSGGMSADWASLSQAVSFDLSADINGDLKVDANDVKEILDILGTCMGDVNLDGVVNQADRDIIVSNMGLTNSASFTVGWSTGDLNGDGIIDGADLALVCPADFNCDGVVAVGDIFDFLNAWFAGSQRANTDGGILGVSDIFAFLNAWFAGC
jgi:hypothetical protein